MLMKLVSVLCVVFGFNILCISYLHYIMKLLSKVLIALKGTANGIADFILKIGPFCDL